MRKIVPLCRVIHMHPVTSSASVWPADSAGRCMTSKVPRVHSDATMGEVRTMLAKEAKNIETLHYVYVLDDSDKLTGVLSIRELFLHPSSARIGEVCRRKDLLSVHPVTHQERAAYMALRHGIKAVPVIDHDHTFLGAIGSDRLLRILYKETHEDLLRRAGVHHRHPMFDSILTLPLHTSILHRLPWLLLGLVGGVFAAQVVSFFEHTLERNLIIAAFIPLIVYMSGAVGAQTVAFIIRDLALDRKIPFLRYFLRQLFVVTVIGTVCALALFGLSMMLYGNMQVSAVLAVSLVAAVLSSLVTGLLIPILFSRFRADPANASGPVATIIQDILSLVIYFLIAGTLLP